MATPEEFTLWFPADILSSAPRLHKNLATIVLNQPMKLPSAVYAHLWNNSKYTVGADGGANSLYEQNRTSQNHLPLNIVIGDLDSVTSQTERYWKSRDTPVIHDSSQETTDFTKAVNHIQAKFPIGPTDIVAIGGLGGRVDQGMSVLHHLYTHQKEPGYPTGRMFLLSTGAVTFVLQSGKHRIKVKEMFEWIGLDKHVGIIPLKEPSVISTKGLEWDVKDWKTEFGGRISTSNHVREEWVEVETTKDVLFTIDLKVPEPEVSEEL